MSPCPFCPPYGFVPSHESALSLALRDGYPVSPGHTLVVPRRHVGSLFELSPAERDDLFAMVARARERLAAEMAPAGYNVGVNDGAAAGQTVPHVHVHLIPRYDGDQEDPRGGVRLIFPERARYWEDAP
jgi:diadenosine tetraphosphate (Ap4A) HIT family hydrolase